MKKSFATVRKLLKQYKWNSIFFKYFKYTLCFFVLPSAIIGVLAFESYSDILEKHALSQAEQNAQKCFTAINDIVSEANKVYSILSNEASVYSYLLSDSIYPKTSSEFNRFYEMDRLFRYLMHTSSFVSTIDIYSPANNYIYSSGSSNFYDKFHEPEILTPFTEDNKQFYAVPSKFSDVAKQYTGITFGYTVISNNTAIGLIAVTVDIEKINAMLSLGENENITLTDNDNIVIYSSDAHQVGKALNIAENKLSIQSFPAFDTIKSDNSVSSASYLTSGLKIFYKNTMDYIAAANKRLMTFAFIMILLAFLVPLFMSLYSSLMIYNLVVRIMSLIHEGNATDKYGKNFDEIEFISDNILNITKAKLEVEEELAKSISRLKATQSVALQMQISPHFLFNTLNVVSFIIMDNIKAENDAQRVITLLSSFLNDVLSSNETITELSGEIETLKKYTEIELIKNNYDFDIEWDIAKETLSLKTVKFILQPIVENALQHGIHPVENIHGKIIIESKISDKQLMIKVRNNGKPIAPDELREIRDNLRLDDMPENHIGLYNVNQRIKIIYGDRYGCRIHSDKNGTTVTILQPIK